MATPLHPISRLGSRELEPLAALLDLLDLADVFTGDAELRGADPVIRSPHRLGEASATAQLLIGAAGAAIWQARGGPSTDISIDIEHALHYLHPTNFVEQAGYPNDVGADRVAVNGVFSTRDGRYVMLEAGPPYAKLLTGYLDFFDCGNNKESFAREVATWDAEDLEDALTAAGLPVCRAFTREQWLAHPQGRALSAVPPIEIVKIGDGDPVPFPDNGSSPLDGVRVLDFTHVLAGPRSTRTLAEYGAEVLHVSSPAFPDTLAQHLGVDVGKYDAYLDLRRPEDLATMRRLAATTDVFASTYRPAVNERFGLLPARLAAASERGIVYMSANAYGHSGPWSNRPGFDQNGQVASGFAMAEGQGGPPKFSPVFYLADLITGYFAAAGMMAALYRRAVEGGSYQVKVSLTRSAMWVQDLGLLDVTAQQDLPATDVYPPATITHPTAYGTVRSLAPALTFSDLRLPTVERLVPYGADPRGVAIDEHRSMTVDAERAGKRRERNPIAALTRMLAVMAESSRLAMGVRELARDLGTQPSSVQRTLEVAREAGLVAPTPGGQWELGWELFRIASLVQGKQPFAAAGPILDRLSEESGETAVLTVYVPHRRARMFVAASPSRHAVRFEPRLYAWLPMHAGATALAILAHRPDVERRAVYAGALDGLSETTLTSPEQLEGALDDVRRLGYAVSRDQVNLGASAVAAPVDSATGVMSSIGIIAPRERFQEATETVLADAVMAAAAELGNRLGDPIASLRSKSESPQA